MRLTDEVVERARAHPLGEGRRRRCARWRSGGGGVGVEERWRGAFVRTRRASRSSRRGATRRARAWECGWCRPRRAGWPRGVRRPRRRARRPSADTSPLRRTGAAHRPTRRAAAIRASAETTRSPPTATFPGSCTPAAMSTSAGAGRVRASRASAARLASATTPDGSRTGLSAVITACVTLTSRMPAGSRATRSAHGPASAVSSPAATATTSNGRPASIADSTRWRPSSSTTEGSPRRRAASRNAGTS
jgi:hypothetical protein